MKQIGYYYDDAHHLFLIGFKNEYGNYTARVIGRQNTYSFEIGYSYFSWDSLTYIGDYNSYKNLEGVLKFIENATFEQLQARYLFLKNLKEDYYRVKYKKAVNLYDNSFWFRNDLLYLFEDLIK